MYKYYTTALVFSVFSTIPTAHAAQRAITFAPPAHTTQKNIRIQLVMQDILSTKADAIINAANNACVGGGGIDGVITHAAGDTSLDARYALPKNAQGVRCPTGEARVTISGDLEKDSINYIIHTAGPDCTKLPYKTNTVLAHCDLWRCYTSIFDIITAINNTPNNGALVPFTCAPGVAYTVPHKGTIKTIAIPAISAAIFACPNTEKAAVAAIAHYIKHAAQNDPLKTIKFVFWPNTAGSTKLMNDYAQEFQRHGFMLHASL